MEHRSGSFREYFSQCQFSGLQHEQASDIKKTQAMAVGDGCRRWRSWFVWHVCRESEDFGEQPAEKPIDR